MSKTEYIVDLGIGDYSDDGHGKVYRQKIKSNLSTKAIEKAYRNGAKKIKFDITDVCQEYEDYFLHLKDWKILEKTGLTLIETFGKDDYKDAEESIKEEEGISLNFDSYIVIYLFIVKIGDPSFDYEFLQDNTIWLGGYGLF